MQGSASVPADAEAVAIATAALEAWARAFRTCEAQAMVGCYAPECLHFGARAKLYVGQAGVLEYFSTLGTRSDRDVRFENLAAVRHGETTVSLAVTAMFSMDGDAKPAMRLTQTLTRTADGWKVGAHHASLMPER